MVTRRLTFAIPGNLDTPTGGYAYDRRVITELRELGWEVNIVDIGDSFPSPNEARLARAHQLLAKTSTVAPVMIDGLAFGVMDNISTELARTHHLVALVHHPLALETGIARGRAEELLISERKALAHARHTITTSRQTARIIASDYSVPEAKITVARPGNDPKPLANGSHDGIFRLLSVGAIVPRKGYDVLIDALAALPDLPWYLTIAGDATRSTETTETLKEHIAARKLADRVRIAGAVSDAELDRLYLEADLFVTSSRFEGYGMAATTAIACGLPVIATNVGAFSDMIGDAGILVAPNDVATLADALRNAIGNPEIRTRLRNAARVAARALPAWRETAQAIARAIESIA